MAAPIYGGPGSLDGSFEGGLDANCNGQDGASTFWPDNPQDCDYFTPDAMDGAQTFRDGPGGSGEAYSWHKAFAHPASEIWTKIDVKREDDVQCFNNLFCLLDSADQNTFFCLSMDSGGRDTTRVTAGGPSCDFADTTAVGSWCQYLFHTNLATGEAELWCDCDGQMVECGDNLDAELPDAVCQGNANPSLAFDGFVLYGSAGNCAWQLDDIRVYDQDPVPEPGGVGFVAGLMLLAVLAKARLRRRHRTRARAQASH